MTKLVFSLLIPLGLALSIYILIFPSEEIFQESININSTKEIISEILLDEKREYNLQPFIKDVKLIRIFNNTNYYEMIEEIDFIIYKKNITLNVSNRKSFQNETFIQLEFVVRAPLNTHVESIFILEDIQNGLTRLTQKFKIKTPWILSKFSFEMARYAQNKLRSNLKEIAEKNRK
jgi:hypothetical protein